MQHPAVYKIILSRTEIIRVCALSARVSERKLMRMAVDENNYQM